MTTVGDGSSLRAVRGGLACAIAVLGASLLAGGAAGLTQAERCESSKLKIVGKYDLCRLKAAAKAVKSGGAPDFSNCDASFAGKWQNAESAAGGQCPSTGDAAAIQGLATLHTTDVATALAGGTPPNCPADLAMCEAALATTPVCGNGFVNVGEDCDQSDLAGETCATQGFAGGTLACAGGCIFDTGGCYAARFVDNADGTITDHRSGLTWEKKVERNNAQNLANPHDADNVYPWTGYCSIATNKRCQPTAAAAALCAANAENSTIGCDACLPGEGTCGTPTTVWTFAADLNSTAFGGHTDWRVPTRNELLELVDLADPISEPLTYAAFEGASCGAACSDLTTPACSCTRAWFYWTATALSPLPTDVYVIMFAFGGIGDTDKLVSVYLRAVRG